MNATTEDNVSIKFSLDEDNIIHLVVNREDEVTINNALKTLQEINFIGEFNTIYDPEQQDNSYYNEFYQQLEAEDLEKINFFINGAKFNQKMKLVWTVLFSPITGYKVNGIIEEAIQHFYGVHTKSKNDQKWFLDAIAMISGECDSNKSTTQSIPESNIAQQYIKLINNFHLDKALEDVEDKSVATRYFCNVQNYIAQFIKVNFNDEKINNMPLTIKLYQGFNDYVLKYENETLLTTKENLQVQQASLRQYLGLN